VFFTILQGRAVPVWRKNLPCLARYFLPKTLQTLNTTLLSLCETKTTDPTGRRIKKKSDLRETGKKFSNMEAKVLSEAKVYVGTYAKYNNGSLSGAWLDLSDYSDKEEFYEACRELHKDEEDAEYMFQDWENVPEGLIGESWISENFFALRDAVEDLSDTEQEAFFVWCNYKSHDLGEEDADDLVRDFRDEYQGEYDDEEDFAYEIVEECYDLPEFAKTYFDYKQFARDLFMCDYWFDDGFVFRAA